jgi:membrane protease YdiL (CAAX protease family)
MWFKTLPQANLSKQLFIMLIFWLLANLIVVGLSSLLFAIFPDFSAQYNNYINEINTLIKGLNNETDIPTQLLEMGKEIKKSMHNNFFIGLIVMQSAFNLINYAFLAVFLRKLFFNKLILDYQKVKIPIYILTLLMFFAAMPILNESIKLNEYLGLNQLNFIPEDTSYTVLVTTYSLVIDSNINHQILIIICMAFIPALSEELFFRGFLQKILGDKLDIHLAILFASLLFSVFHFEIVAFFYRFLFGVILGYLYYFTKNLTPSILLHFINNFSSILAVNYIPNTQDLNDMEQFPTSVLLFSCLSLGFIFYTLHTYHQQANK